MTRLFALLVLFFALVPTLIAQPDADRALVAQIYDDLSRGDIESAVAALDDHVLWIEDAHSPQAGRYFGPGTVAAHVLLPHVTMRRTADALDSLFLDGNRLIAVGTTRRADPATGRPIVARFRHVWWVLDGRVVSVHRSDDGPDLATSDLCDSESC